MTKKKSDTAVEVLGGFRLAFYLFLSRAFSREPDKAVLKNMEQILNTLMEVWKTLGLPSDPDIEAGRDFLKTFFLEFHKDPNNAVHGLAREYASLFLGTGSDTVSPCESAHRSTTGLLYQSALFEVQKAYREIDMAKSDVYQEPDDHIAVELSYMARLCEMMQESAITVKEQALHSLMLQQDFLDAHLLQWVPSFSRHLIAVARPGLYRAMAHLLKGYMEIDNSLVELMRREITDESQAGS